LMAASRNLPEIDSNCISTSKWAWASSFLTPSSAPEDRS